MAGASATIAGAPAAIAGTKKTFHPRGFLWGVSTAGHQTEAIA